MTTSLEALSKSQSTTYRRSSGLPSPAVLGGGDGAGGSHGFPRPPRTRAELARAPLHPPISPAHRAGPVLPPSAGDQSAAPQVRIPAPPPAGPAAPDGSCPPGAGGSGAGSRQLPGGSVIEPSRPGRCPRCGCNPGRDPRARSAPGTELLAPAPRLARPSPRGHGPGTGSRRPVQVLRLRRPPRPPRLPPPRHRGPRAGTQLLSEPAPRSKPRRPAGGAGARLPEAGGGAGGPRGGAGGRGGAGRAERPAVGFRSDARRPAPPRDGRPRPSGRELRGWGWVGVGAGGGTVTTSDLGLTPAPCHGGPGAELPVISPFCRCGELSPAQGSREQAVGQRRQRPAARRLDPKALVSFRMQ